MNVYDYIRLSVRRGLVALVRRRIYLIMMIIAPIVSAWFLLDLMKVGTAGHAPVGIVDLDRSSMSRALTRRLSTFEQVNVTGFYHDFTEAREAVQRGEILGFFYIPADLSEKALGGQKPTLSYYINYAYYAPASMQFKGFKTITVLANGAIVSNVMTELGLEGFNGLSISSTLQPIVVDAHMPGNPWLNYSYYLNPSFIPTLFALIIFLVTAFSIGIELKYKTCRDWVLNAGGSMGVAVTGKLMPQTVIFFIVGWTIQWLMYRVYHLPLNCPPWHMIIAMPLFVLANQAFALTVMSLVPNFRYGTTICSLFGVLAFSLGGYSLPGEAMYSWVTPIGYILPAKYYFLLSVDQALNGLDLYYSKWYYAALVAFTILPWAITWRLKRECLNPVYVP